MKHFLIPFLFFCINSSIFAQVDSVDIYNLWGNQSLSSKPINDKKFLRNNFGLMIHWGLYSYLGGEWKDKTYYGISEWIMSPYMANIPINEYKSLAQKFNPTDFDANKIAQMAKDAGMKFIVFTGKHHDGFAMFNSQADSFNIFQATAFKRDPIEELSQACKKAGLGLGIYYSQYQDWTAPGANGGPTVNVNGEKVGFVGYFYSKCLPQVVELCSNYGDLDYLWFDTPGSTNEELINILIDTVKKLQPHVLINSRIGYDIGDYETKGDMEIPIKNETGMWQVVDTDNDSWGYSKFDRNFKGPKELLERLIATISRGGTYLLNTGLDKLGNIQDISKINFAVLKEWMNHYTDALNVNASPWQHSLPWGEITLAKNNTLYAFVYQWPEDGRLFVPGIKNKIKSITFLKEEKTKRIKFIQDNNWLILKDLFERPNELIPIIKIEYEDNGDGLHVDSAFGLMPNAPLTLSSVFANVKNCKINIDRWMEKFGEWKTSHVINEFETGNLVQWHFNVFKPGLYHIYLRYKGQDRLTWEVSTNEGLQLSNNLSATKKFSNYQVGMLEIKKAGEIILSLRLIEGDMQTSELESISLVPINIIKR